MKFSICQDSRIGRRSTNQDRVGFAHTGEACLAVVCDGMGGHRHGEVAAHIVVEHLVQAFRQMAAPRLDDAADFLNEQILEAHWAINRYAGLRAIPLEDAPRTTVVACVIQQDTALWAHTGDSRLYLVRDGRLILRTTDHSHVQQLIDAGEISEAEAQHHPARNLVMTCLGGDEAPRIEVSEPRKLHPGDTFALCSDGVWVPLGDLLAAGLMYPLEKAVPQLLNRAEELNGATSDNLSLLALRWESAAGGARCDERTEPDLGADTVAENFGFEKTQPNLSAADIARAVDEIKAQIQAQAHQNS